MVSGNEDIAAPLCPDCGRPLQKDRDTCMYCGRVLTKEDLEKIQASLDEEMVRSRVEQVEAVLKISSGKRMGWLGRFIAKAVVCTLALLAVLLISWVAEWNPIFITTAAIFFAIPVIMILQRL